MLIWSGDTWAGKAGGGETRGGDRRVRVTRVFFWVGVPAGRAGGAGRGVGGSDLRWRNVD